FLRRVLGVLYGPVGPVGEPLRVLGHPRVVWRAVDREVERHLEPEAPGALDEPVEVAERAEHRVDGRVAALLTPDRPGPARLARPPRGSAHAIPGARSRGPAVPRDAWPGRRARSGTDRGAPGS